MRLHLSAAFPVLLISLCTRANAQERTTDPLAPVTQCVNSDGFHYETKDRLAATARSRTVKTSSGPKEVSTADGYRLMIYRKSSSPLVNLKLERSAEGRFANDRLLIIDQMKELAAGTKPPYQASLETSMKNGIEVLAVNNTDIEHVSGVISLYSLLDAANGNVATAYVLNQRPEVREFATNAEYAGLRDRFIRLLSDCMASSAQDVSERGQ